MKFVPGVFALALLFAGCSYRPASQATKPPPSPPMPTEVHRLAFGSCSQSGLPQPLWPVIASLEPDVWVWTGDAVYADTEDMAAMKDQYDRQLMTPTYHQFIQKVPVVGTWDDHDYGVNDGGAEYPMKEESKQLFLDFIGEPKESPRRQQAGLYTEYVIGPEGRRVKLILLDTRFNREKPSESGDVLGEQQWRWLEHSLETVPSEVTILVTSIQLLPEGHPFEKWANFPRSKARLLRLLSRHLRAPLIVISGDRHLGEISRRSIESAPYPLIEVTASGMTHSFRGDKPEENPDRVGAQYREINFGMIIFNWDSDDSCLRVQIRDRFGGVRIEEVVSCHPQGITSRRE